MNLIQIILLIGVWILAISGTKNYINLRDEFIKSDKTEKSEQLKRAEREMISKLILAVIYTILKLT